MRESEVRSIAFISCEETPQRIRIRGKSQAESVDAQKCESVARQCMPLLNFAQRARRCYVLRGLCEALPCCLAWLKELLEGMLSATLVNVFCELQVNTVLFFFLVPFPVPVSYD